MQGEFASIGLRHRADATDAPRVYAVLLERSAWLESKGILQWSPPYPRERFRRVGIGDINGGASVFLEKRLGALTEGTVAWSRP